MRHTGKRQLGLFKQDMTSTVREDGIPVYRVSLVRVSKSGLESSIFVPGIWTS